MSTSTQAQNAIFSHTALYSWSQLRSRSFALAATRLNAAAAAQACDHAAKTLDSTLHARSSRDCSMALLADARQRSRVAAEQASRAAPCQPRTASRHQALSRVPQMESTRRRMRRRHRFQARNACHRSSKRLCRTASSRRRLQAWSHCLSSFSVLTTLSACRSSRAWTASWCHAPKQCAAMALVSRPKQTSRAPQASAQCSRSRRLTSPHSCSFSAECALPAC
mmetsp:Transcript_10796/g.33726  ORF Transcript_10796/g.33726 Transcript_10796/m.33726 type:complete len:223 (-) Transcript_10796:239-907(-)